MSKQQMTSCCSCERIALIRIILHSHLGKKAHISSRRLLAEQPGFVLRPYISSTRSLVFLMQKKSLWVGEKKKYHLSFCVAPLQFFLKCRFLNISNFLQCLHSLFLAEMSEVCHQPSKTTNASCQTSQSISQVFQMLHNIKKRKGKLKRAQ